MERKEYLRRCQIAAQLLEQTTADKLPDDVTCVYCGANEYIKGTEYYPMEYILNFDKHGKPQHGALLHSLTANSVIKCTLDDLEVV